MQLNEDLIRSVVAQVLAEVGRAPMVDGRKFTGRHGIFTCVDEAVAAAREAFEQLSERTLEDRKKIIDAGFDGLQTKPINVKDFLETVAATLKKHAGAA